MTFQEKIAALIANKEAEKVQPQPLITVESDGERIVIKKVNTE